MKPEQSAQSLCEIGNQFFHAKQWQKALTQYQLALDLDPTFVKALFNKGIVLKILKRFPEAISAFSAVAEKESSHEKALYNHADCLIKMGDHKEALIKFRLLVEQYPDNIEIRKAFLMLHHRYAAFVGYVALDLKLNQNGEIKILEFGDGFQSGVVGLQTLQDADNINFASDLIRDAAKDLHSDCRILSSPGSQFAIDEASFKALSQTTAKKVTDPENVNDYRMLVGSPKYFPLPNDILLMNNTVQSYIAEDKYLQHEAFDRSKMLMMRPATVILSKGENTRVMLKKVNRVMGEAKFVVIKEPDFEQGQGVLVIEKKDLHLYLDILSRLDPMQRMQRFMASKIDDPALQSLLMMECQHSKIIVEEYVTSKPIFSKGGIYDATMRVMCLVVRNERKIELCPIAAYWKLPKSPVNDSHANRRDKTISSFHEDHFSSETVAASDREDVYRQLKENLPAVFAAVLGYDYMDEMTLKTATTKVEKNHKYLDLLRYANILLDFNELLIAEHLIRMALKIVPNGYRGYHILGQLFQTKGIHKEAIQNFSLAIQYSPSFIRSIFGRAKSYFELGQAMSALKDCEKCFQLGYDLQCETKQLLEENIDNPEVFSYLYKNKLLPPAISNELDITKSLGDTVDVASKFASKLKVHGIDATTKTVGLFTETQAVSPLSTLLQQAQKQIPEPDQVQLIFKTESGAEDCQRQLQTATQSASAAAAAASAPTDYAIEKITPIDENEAGASAVSMVAAVQDYYVITLSKDDYNQILQDPTAYDELEQTFRVMQAFRP